MYPRAETAVIDVQFVVDANGRFIIKEMAVLKMHYTFADYYLIRPPCSFKYLPKHIKYQNTYNTNNINKLDWYCGYTDFCKIAAILKKYKKYYILVKGAEKKSRKLLL